MVPTVKGGLALFLCCVVAGFPVTGSSAADPEEAQYNVVVTLYNAGQWEAAIRKIEEREAQNLSEPMRIRYLFARALALEKGGKSGDAARVYEALVAKYPDAPEGMKARLSGVFIRYEARDFDGVIQAAGRIKPDALSAAERQQLAVMTAESWMAKGEHRKAADAFQQAIQLGADRGPLAPKLFSAYYQLGMHREMLDLSAAGIPGLAADLLAALRAHAFLELGQFPQAEAEAKRVPAGSESLPRASFTLAQALIKQGKLADAVGPLQTAIAGLNNPPVPPSAHLALAECLLAAGKAADAENAVNLALARSRALPDAEVGPFRAQAALLTVRIASAMGDSRKLAAAVADARARIPPNQLPGLLYARLFALHEAGDDAAILGGMKDDLAVFQDQPQEGQAVLLYAATLKRAGKGAEAERLLDAYVGRRPDTDEALRARVDLANLALVREDYPRAAERLRGVLGRPDAAAKLGAETFAECRYNSALAAHKTGDTAGAIGTLAALLAAKPSPELGASAALLLGQAHAQAGDHQQAAQAWRQALAYGKGVDPADVRDRIGRLLLAAGDAAGARAEYDALEKQLGGFDKMPREAAEAAARARYAAGDVAAAAASYEALHARFNAAVHAYEAAVCFEKIKKWAEAEQGYVRADKGRASLPDEYAARLTENLNRVRVHTGTGDRGLAHWLGRLATDRPDAEFDSAAAAICRIADAGKLDRGTVAKLAASQEAYPADHIRRYAVGAVRLRVLADLADDQELRKLAGALADAFSAHEKAFAAQSWGATVAPAMIWYFRGEGERRSGNHADALAAYETVLAAYPYNEWPDAAACGAAECYAALGDIPTALARLKEVLKTAADNAASTKWVEHAKKRITVLTEGK